MKQPRPWELDLKSYDWLVFNTSAGKDSQCMMDFMAPYIAKAGKTSRTIAVHADMGRCEWPGTLELAKEQAEHYGFYFRVAKRRSGDLLQQVEERGMWPDRARRYCTSDHKTNQCHQMLTTLSRQARRDYKVKHLKILYMLGIRGDESEDRRVKDPFVLGCTRGVCEACKGIPKGAGRKRSSPRTVHTYLPIFDWTEDQVWDRIRRSKVRYHWAYSLGMRRLSCVFCLAGETEIVTRQGIAAISSLVGKANILVPKVTPFGLSSHGVFQEVEIRSFGVQRLWKIALHSERQTKVVYATAEHRWLLQVSGKQTGDFATIEKMTRDLVVGEKFRSVHAQPVNGVKVPVAIAHGFVYGDGSVGKDERPATLSIYNYEKDQALFPFFVQHEWKQYAKSKRIYGLPRLWKEPPSMRESRSYLLSWLAGYFAADGCVSTSGQVVLSSASLASIKVARDVAVVCGVRYGSIRSVMRSGFAERPKTPLYSLTLDARDLPDWFFIIETHADRIKERSASRSTVNRLWTVVSVEESERVEEVFCAIVPTAHAFGLANGLMTGNCIFATKAALILAGHHNRALLNEYVRVEEKIGHSFKYGLPMVEIKRAVERGEGGEITDSGDWCM